MNVFKSTKVDNYKVVGAKLKGTSVQHMDKSSKYHSFSNVTGGEVSINGHYVDAAIALASGRVSVGETNLEDKRYLELTLDNGNVVSILFSDDTFEYEADIDITDANYWTPVVLVWLIKMLDERGSNELKETLAKIVEKCNTHTVIAEEDAYVLCDYINCRMMSRNKASLDIDVENIDKVRLSNIRNGEDILAITKDITSKYYGKGGNFVKVIFNDSETTTTTSSNTIDWGKYKLEVDLSEVEKSNVPNITGAVDREDYIEALDMFHFSKDDARPHNNILCAGPSGSGKSFFGPWLAWRLGLPFISFSMGDESGETFTRGGLILDNGVTRYEPSPFAKAVQRPCVIEIAECTAAYASRLTALYDWLDKDKMRVVMDDGTVIKRHPWCIIVFTCNIYGCLNDIAPSLVARASTIMRLPFPKRDMLEKIILREINFEKIDVDIMDNVLDCVEKIEPFLQSKKAPKGCESSIRGYAYWALKCQISRNNGKYNPIRAAKSTILPIITSSIGFNETIENNIVQSIISPTFNYFDREGVI